jgi:hypothetical protein
MGDVVEDVAGLDRALAAASEVHPAYAPVQSAYVARMMGSDDKGASNRAANVVLDVLITRGKGIHRIATEGTDAPALA